MTKMKKIDTTKCQGGETIPIWIVGMKNNPITLENC